MAVSGDLLSNPLRLRPISIRWISDVPSKIVKLPTRSYPRSRSRDAATSGTMSLVKASMPDSVPARYFRDHLLIVTANRTGGRRRLSRADLLVVIAMLAVPVHHPADVQDAGRCPRLP
jgi:hypothetical protein